MDTQNERKWFTKKRYIIPLAILGIVGIANLGGNKPSPKTPPVVPQVQGVVKQVYPETVQRVQDQPQEQVKQQTEPGLSNNNTYINTYGNEVHSPAYTNDKSIPSGATARCGDGTYSFSQSRRGTCSHHGGVEAWLN